MNLAQAVKVSRTLCAEKKIEVQQDIFVSPELTTIFGAERDYTYIPNPTGEKFHVDDTFVKLIQGPYGSGKSTICLHDIVRRACAMPYWHNGRRRLRCAIVRNTRGELESTTLQTWLQWFGELGVLNKKHQPRIVYEHHFNDGHGIVELELWFLALDKPQDLAKVKSLEVTMVYLNESMEIPGGAISHFKGRLNGRYPSKEFCREPYWSGIVCDTNAPDGDHWQYKMFEESSSDDYKIFHQPEGLVTDEKGVPIKDSGGNYIQNTKCDNHEHMNDDYYVKMAANETQEFIKVYCLGHYGTVAYGKLVYPEFNSDLHVVPDIQPIQGEPLYLGWDGGFTPACVVVQIGPRGQILVLKEYVAADVSTRIFGEMVVLPGLVRDFPYNFNNLGCSVHDPSGTAGFKIGPEFSPIGELNAIGLKTEPARTNDIEPRIGAVRFFLNRMNGGQPCFLISQKGCPSLIKGFLRDYHYKRIKILGEERYRDVPDKNSSSHAQDALQYVALEVGPTALQTGKPKNESDYSNPVLRIF